VENEERVVVAALRLANTVSEAARFWVKDVQAQLVLTEPGTTMNGSTVNRALNRMVAMGWMRAAWETADPDDRLSSKPRLYFRFTDEGLAAAREIVEAKRRELPLWVLYPWEVLGERAKEPRLGAGQDAERADGTVGRRAPRRDALSVRAQRSGSAQAAGGEERVGRALRSI
jgi:DNA-binding PadR family transcriptional regulator